MGEIIFYCKAVKYSEAVRHKVLREENPYQSSMLKIIKPPFPHPKVALVVPSVGMRLSINYIT